MSTPPSINLLPVQLQVEIGPHALQDFVGARAEPFGRHACRVMLRFKVAADGTRRPDFVLLNRVDRWMGTRLARELDGIVGREHLDTIFANTLADAAATRREAAA